jgi:hypothetical protein
MINSLKLKHVEMYFGCSDTEIRLDELTVVNAPCLERLHHREPYEDNIYISIISAPKLKILGCITENIFRLELCTTVFKVREAFFVLSFIAFYVCSVFCYKPLI